MHFKQCLCLCLENPMDRGTWWATVHRVAKSRTRLKWYHAHTHAHTHTHTHTRTHTHTHVTCRQACLHFCFYQQFGCRGFSCLAPSALIPWAAFRPKLWIWWWKMCLPLILMYISSGFGEAPLHLSWSSLGNYIFMWLSYDFPRIYS